MPSGAAPAFFFFTEGFLVKITTFHNRPVRHVRHMPDGSVILTLNERQLNGRPRHLRVSLAEWVTGRGILLLDSHATHRAQSRQPARRCG